MIFLANRRDQVRELTNTLYLATRNRLPLDKALAPIHEPNWRFASRITFLMFLFMFAWPMLLVVYLSGVHIFDAYYSRLKKVRCDLEKGIKLSEALHRRLRAMLPPGYVAIVRSGEESDQLADAFRLIRETDVDNERVRIETSRILTFMLLFFPAIIIQVLSLVLVIPKYAKMYEEMLGDTPLPAFTEAYLSFAQFFVSYGFFVVLTVLFILLSWWTAKRFLICRWAALFMLSGIPFLRELLAKRTRVQVYQLMALKLKSGVDIADACLWVANNCSSFRYQRKLRQVELMMHDGISWENAWQEAGIGRPLERWILSNSAQRQDPASGFQHAAQLLKESYDVHCSYLAVIGRHFILLIFVLMVGAYAFGMFLPIIQLINHSTDLAL